MADDYGCLAISADCLAPKKGFELILVPAQKISEFTKLIGHFSFYADWVWSGQLDSHHVQHAKRAIFKCITGSENWL